MLQQNPKGNVEKQHMPLYRFRFSKTAKFVKISSEQINKSLLKNFVFSVLVSFLSCNSSLFAS